MKKMQAYRRGLWSEGVVCWYLRLKGYHIYARRFKTPVGEVDIIATKRNTLVAVEVKARGNKKVQEVLAAKQRERIIRATSLFVAKHPEFANFTIRFDLVVIYPFSIPVHMSGAWQV